MDDATICNLALSRIGYKQPLNSLSDGSVAAQWCTFMYPANRDRTMRYFAWPFAVKRAALALTPSTADAWLCAYELPEDLLRACELLVPGDRRPTPEAQYPFIIEGRLLLTDLEGAWLRYVGRVEDPGLFSPDFVDALAWSLASELAFPLAARRDIEQVCLQRYLGALHDAQAVASNEEHLDPAPDSEFVRVR